MRFAYPRGVLPRTARSALFLAGAALACAPARDVRPSLPRGDDGPPGAPADARAAATAAAPGREGSPPAAAAPSEIAAAPDWPLPGPAPRPAPPVVAGVGLADDASCARCHDEIAAEWQTSLHRRAWQNDYFLRSYATERQALCRGCHAPSADPSAEPPLAAREVGVGCTTCHVVAGGIVGARAVDPAGGPGPAHPGQSGPAPGHAVLGDPRLATAAACGACHDFPFPDDPAGAGPRQQDTLGEHRRSAAADKPCQSCHMPVATGKGGAPHRDHSFRVQGDPDMLARAVRVTGAALRGGQLALSLAPGDIGHAFPTDDVFRRAEVRATPLNAAGHPLGPAATLVLGRTFGPAPEDGGPARVLRSDTRLSGDRILTFSVPAAASRVRYSIVWQRLPPSLAERLGMSMRDHETVVLEGAVSR